MCIIIQRFEYVEQLNHITNFGGTARDGARDVVKNEIVKLIEPYLQWKKESGVSVFLVSMV